MDANLRLSGVERLGDISSGTHFCLFYETENDLLEVLVAYFRPGVASNEFCLWITSDSSSERARSALLQAIPSAGQRLEEGGIEIISCQEWCEHDEFDGPRMMEAFDTKLAQALEKGYARMKVLADEAWLDEKGWKAFSEYEAKIDDRFAGKPISILCAYPTASHSAADILDIARTHRFIAAKRNGSWEILEAPELKHARVEPERTGAEFGAQTAEQQKLDFLTELKTSSIFRYAIPVVAVAASLGLTFLLQPYVLRTPLFFLSIMISTWVGGIGPGLLAVLLSTLSISVLLSPAGILESRFQNIPNVISFLITALLVGSWSAARRRVEHSLRKTRDDLESKVQERTTGLRQMNQALQAEIIDHRRSEESLRTSEYRLQAAIDAADIVLWERDLASGQITWLGHHEKLLGFAPGELEENTLASFEKRVHPEDVEQLRAVRQRALEERSEYSHEYRVVWRDGSIHWLRAQGKFIYDAAGRPMRLYGAVLDITQRKGSEETIRKSEQVLREAESLGHTGSWEQNLVTGEIFNTEENLRLFFGDDQSKGADLEDYTEILHPDDREYVMQRRMQLLAEGGPRDIEYRVVWPDGSVHVIFGRATVVYDELGQALRVYGTNVDVTERRQAEEEMRQYAIRMEALAQISRTFAEVGLDYQSVLNTVAQRTAELIGDSCVITLFSEDHGRAFPVAFHHPEPKALALMEEALLHIWQGGTDTERFQMLLAGESIYFPVVDAEQYRAQSEPEFWHYVDTVGVSSVLIVPLKAQGRVIGTLGITRDSQGDPYTRDDQLLLQNIADRAAMSIQNAQLFRQVEGAREQLEALSRRLLEVQEVERRAITMELHDRVGQNLTGLSIHLQNMKALLSENSAKVLTAQFDDAQNLLEEITRQIRDLMAELHLPELEDYGLAVALETYAERAASRANLELIADLPDLAPPRLPSEFRIALFRAAQEAISNVLKHANATQLEVSLEQLDGKVRLMIEDNGLGFDPEAVSKQDSQTWGLKIMRERIESIGGTVLLESKPQQGTRVTFEIERPS